MPLRLAHMAALALCATGSAGCHALAGLDDLVPGGHPTPDVVWVRTFGDPGEQRITALAIDGNDDVVVAGTFRGTLDFGTGPLVASDHDLFVARLAADGTPRWARRFGHPESLVVSGLVLGPSGDVHVAGHFEGWLEVGADRLETKLGGADVFVLQLDAAGAPRWARQAGGPAHQAAWGLALDEDENVLIAGSFDQSIAFEAPKAPAGPSHEGADQMMLWKLDRVGSHLWSAAYGDDAPQRAQRIVTDGSNMLVAGTVYGTTELGPEATLSAKGAPFLAKLDGGGGVLWSGVLGDGRRLCFDWCELELTLDSARRPVVAGAFLGELTLGAAKVTSSLGADVFVTLLDGHGRLGGLKIEGLTSFGGLGAERPYGLTLGADGGPIVSGTSNGEVSLGSSVHTGDDRIGDAFVARLSPTLELTGSHWFPIRAESSDLDEPGGPKVATNSRGERVVAGSFHGELEVGGARVKASGGDEDYDAFVVTLPRP